MKKKTAVKLSFPIVFALLLSGCGNMEDKKPTNSHEKVSYAFNGVDKSLKSPNSKKRLLNEKKEFPREPSSDVISTIFSYTEENGNDPDISYDDTPLVQFRYLKSLYDAIGSDFAFDTRYSHTFTGDIYYDFTIDEPAEEIEANKQHYSLDFSFLINIDDEDFITADVGFDLTFTHEQTVRHQFMYSELLLDYDMNESSPTFIFTMRDVSDLLEHEDENEKLVTAEYDYIDVRKNSINEVRKFCIGSRTGFEHQDEEDFVYKYMALRGYRDGKAYKTRDPYNKNRGLREAVITGCGLENELSTYKAFFQKPSVENDKISGVIGSFSQIYGKDFVYHIANSGADEEWEPRPDEGGGGGGGGERHNRFISFTDQNGMPISSYQFDHDVRINDIFAKDYGMKITLFQDNYEVLANFSDLSSFGVVANSRCYSKSKDVKIYDGEERFSDVLVESGYILKNLGFMDISLELHYIDDSGNALTGGFDLEVYDENLDKTLAKVWPAEYLNEYLIARDLIPTFEGRDVYFVPNIQEQSGRGGDISLYDVTSNEITAYTNKLITGGFRDTVDGNGNHTYKKRLADNNVLAISVYGPGKDNDSEGNIRFSIDEVTLPEQTIREYILDVLDSDDIDIPDFPNGENYEIIDWLDDDNGVRVNDVQEDDYLDFIDSLVSSYGFSLIVNEPYHDAYKYVNGIFFRIRYNEYDHCLYFFKTPLEFSFVGKDGNWDITNTDYVFTNLSVNSSGELFSSSMEITFSDEETFKIILNHDWAEGEYNYDSISWDKEGGGKPGDDFNNFSPEGEYNNIKIHTGGTYRVTIQFSLYGSAKLKEAIFPDRIFFAKVNNGL